MPRNPDHKLFTPEMFKDPEFTFYRNPDRDATLRDRVLMHSLDICMKCGEAEGKLDGPCSSSVAWLRHLLDKHGICLDCGQLWSHDIDGPFAHCGCGCSEWYDFTPHMRLEKKLFDLKQSPYNKHFELIGQYK